MRARPTKAVIHLVVVSLPLVVGCHPPQVTAVSLIQTDCRYGKESGIPFYLPKPLLIVTKNFRNIEEAKVGLTNTAPIPTGFDDQAKYADLNARTNFNGLNGPAVANAVAQPDAAGNVNTGTALASPPVLFSSQGAPIAPGEVPSDGLAPATFFTYQIVFVPDMTQKYGLKIRGGPGEIRAAMNLVNGWQFTGIGPFYMKDSSTAQDVLASGISARLGGQAAADILNAAADLAKAFPGGRQGANVPSEARQLQRLTKTIGELPLTRVCMTLPNFAEIHVYEPHLTPEGQMEWNEIVHLCFNRDYLGTDATCAEFTVSKKAEELPLPKKEGADSKTGPQAANVGTDPSVARAAVAAVFGLPVNSPALAAVAPGGLQAGATGSLPVAGVGSLPPGGVNQIQVDCGAGGCKPSREFNLFRFGGWCHPKEVRRPTIQNRILTAAGTAAGAIGGGEGTSLASPGQKPAKAGGAQGANVPETPGAIPSIINQPIFNQPCPPGLNPLVAPVMPRVEENK